MVTRPLSFVALLTAAAACWPSDEAPDDLVTPAPTPADQPTDPPPPINNSVGHWVQQLELPQPVGANDYGEGVDIDGSTIVIGDGGTGANFVTVLDRVAGVWGITTTLAPVQVGNGDNFGKSLSLSGDALAVGARYFDDPLVGNSSGAAWVYLRTAGTWSSGQMLSHPGLAPGDHFGHSVAVDGNTVAVGAPDSTYGEVYIYTYAAGSWGWRYTLSGSQAGAKFGQEVTLEGDTLFVGSPHYDQANKLSTGQVAIFTRNPDQSWSPLPPLFPNAILSNNAFGFAIDVDGDTLVICDKETGNEGRAHVYRAPGGQWSSPVLEQSVALFNQNTADSSFVTSCAIDGNDLLIGDQNHTSPSSVGQVLYYRHSTNWTPGTSILGPTANLVYYGVPIAMDSQLAIVGASHAGAAYLHAWVGERCTLDTECPTEFCSNLFCCDSRCGECGQCDASGSEGECQPQAAGASDPDCGAYLCNGTDLTCPTTCESDDECAATHHCSGDSCVPDGELGAACISASQCVSGQCIDGVCCDTACDEQCLACDVVGSEGTCSPVTGAPHGARPECPADRCEEGLAEADFACDGSATACQPASQSDCAPYRCGADACRDTCEVDGDCVGGFVCRNLACVPEDTQCDGSVLTEPGGSTVDCAPYRCNDGSTCPNDCTSSAQCIEGYQCNSEGRCVEQTPAPVTEAGCACRLSPPHSSSAGWWMLGLLAAAGRRRQKR